MVLFGLTAAAGARLKVADFTGVPLAECLRRNAVRADKPSVPEEWIRWAHATYIAVEEGGRLERHGAETA